MKQVHITLRFKNVRFIVQTIKYGSTKKKRFIHREDGITIKYYPTMFNYGIAVLKYERHCPVFENV